MEDYFTPDEIDRVRLAPLDKRETLITAIWSAKESALKVLRLGLTIDPRRYSSHDWLEFTLTCMPSYTETLRGWWRTWGEYVLTVAIVT